MRLVTLEELPDEGVSHDPEIRKRAMLRRGDVPHLTNFSRAVLLPGQRVSAHAHVGMHEIFYVASGEGVLRSGAVAHALAAGSCAVVGPGESHEIENAGGGELVLLYFGVETA
jgi:mannose-6-phosphate isomerase-like protein (cupin superfamily)